jgi:PleD family two-component response regulator
MGHVDTGKAGPAHGIEHARQIGATKAQALGVDQMIEELPPQRREPGPQLARPKILIVDDRRENLVATRKILRRLDADIVEVSSGTEALSQLLRHPFAVVLLDVQMPEMDGFETASLMQEDADMRDTPVIFVTAIN